jgi:hypothetical protein
VFWDQASRAYASALVTPYQAQPSAKSFQQATAGSLNTLRTGWSVGSLASATDMAQPSVNGAEASFLPSYYGFSTVSDTSALSALRTNYLPTPHVGPSTPGEFARASSLLGECLTPAAYAGARTRGASASQILAETPVVSVWATPAREGGTASSLKNAGPSLRVVPLQRTPSSHHYVTGIFAGRSTKSATAPVYLPSSSKEVCIGRRSHLYAQGALGLDSGLRVNQFEMLRELSSTTTPTLVQPRDTTFSGAMLGDYFTYALTHQTRASGSWLRVGAISAAEAVAFSALTGPEGAVAYDSVEEARPVRLSVNKVYEPSLFAAKTDGVPTNLLRFSNKLLFDWSMNWSDQTMGFALPLYKTYRGGFIRKPNSNYWAVSGTSLAEYDKCIWSNFFVQISKTAGFAFTPSAQVRVNAMVPSKTTSPVFDAELVPFIKNHIHLLPTPHEEFDINYVYQHWAPEINTTRRSDHATRFRTTWNSLFTLNFQNRNAVDPRLAVVAATTPALGSEFFQTASARDMLLNPLYAQNVAVNKYSTNTLQLSARFKPLAVEELFNTASYSFRAAPANTPNASGTAFNDLERVVTSAAPTQLATAPESVPLAPSLFVRLSSTPFSRADFAQNPEFAMLWSDIWEFRQTVSNTRATSVRQHASDTPSYLLSRLALVLTARDREVTRVARALGNTNTQQLSQTGASTTLLSRDVTNLLTAPEFTTQSKGAATTLLDTVSRLAGLNRTRGRSAYESAKRDIGGIRRLRVTKGICLPADTPIHLVCGSKDVIHSWAIPGLGVKIDCIPGYNSHRRVLFRWRGIYWGQCMEVCGRYHH